LRATDFGNILVTKWWWVKGMNPTFESHRFLKTSVFQNVDNQSENQPPSFSTHRVQHCRKLTNLTQKKNCGNVSLVWQWVNNRIHYVSSDSDALESTHISICVLSTSVLHCRGPSSSPFVLTLLSSDLIASVQTFLSWHVTLHFKYCKISDSDLLHLYGVSCPSDNLTPYHADCYTSLSLW